jgi:preprotein translocase subunit SecF
MLIGVIVGTYSSVYVAAPIIVSLTPPDEDAGAAPAKTKIRMDPNGVV